VSSELARRVVFAVVAAPIVVGIVGVGGAALAALLAIASALAAWEFFRLARAGAMTPLDHIGVALAGIAPLVVHARFLRLYDPDRAVGPLSLGVLVVLVLFAIAIWARGVDGRPLGAVAATVLGVVYTGGCLSYGYAIRYHDYGFADATLAGVRLPTGALLLLLPLLLTWASDIGAYAVGRSIGRRKLIPSVSPGKTVEGAVGGVAASVLVAWAYGRWILSAASLSFAPAPWGLLVAGAVVSAAAQIGDLVESLLKREAKVKDSSHLIPGHGGVLDRLDSLFFVLPLWYVLMSGLRWAPR
jgi:phosphatidate cytidylyltransferase